MRAGGSRAGLLTLDSSPAVRRRGAGLGGPADAEAGGVDGVEADVRGRRRIGDELEARNHVRHRQAFREQHDGAAPDVGIEHLDEAAERRAFLDGFVGTHPREPEAGIADRALDRARRPDPRPTRAGRRRCGNPAA